MKDEKNISSSISSREELSDEDGDDQSVDQVDSK